MGNMEIERIEGGAEENCTNYSLRKAGPVVSLLLKRRSRVPLLLRTPYGIVDSGTALMRTESDSDQIVSIASPNGEACIGKAIRRWYGLRSFGDVRRAEITLDFIVQDEPRAVLVPLAVMERGSRRWRQLDSTAPEPLGLNAYSLSRLWRRRIERLREMRPGAVTWLRHRVGEVLKRHPRGSRRGWTAEDLTDTSRLLSLCGCSLGEQVGQPRVFPEARFRFGALPTYHCPVELCRTLKEFEPKKYACGSLPRAVVLTFREQQSLLPRNFDHFALETLQNLLN
jgi:hypothetical protein